MPTTKWALRYPAGSDAPTGHTDIQHLAEDTENLALPLVGTIGSRPTASTAKSGRTYYASDTNNYYFSDGTAWQEITALDTPYAFDLWRNVPYAWGEDLLAASQTNTIVGLTIRNQNPARTAANGWTSFGMGSSRFTSLVYLDADDFPVPSRNVKLRVKASVGVGSTNPGITFTFGLHRASGFGQPILNWTCDTTPIGVAQVISPTGGVSTVNGAQFDCPADGWYSLICVLSGATPAAAYYLAANLQMRYV